MEPAIPKGSLCLFRKAEKEAIEGMITLFRARGGAEQPAVGRIDKRTVLEVRDGNRSEKTFWIAECIDKYAQPVLFNKLDDIEILGVFEKVIVA